ncbi:hypothetical protein Hanom_Chr12g01115211 [Helianthus anomalus]
MTVCYVEEWITCREENDLGVVCFFSGKRSAVCGPHLQASAGEEVDQMSAVCKEKRVCFLYIKPIHTLNTHNTQNSLSLIYFSLPPSTTTTTVHCPPPPQPTTTTSAGEEGEPENKLTSIFHHSPVILLSLPATYKP